MKKKSDAYLKVVEWSEEDECYIGSCPGLMFGGVHGETEREVYEALCEVVDEWVEHAETEGFNLPEATANKKYSGRFLLRVSEDVHVSTLDTRSSKRRKFKFLL